MTSLAVESNYSNMTAARGRRRMIIRNPDNTTTITHTTETPYTSNNTNNAYNGNLSGYSTNNNSTHYSNVYNSNLNKSTNSNMGGSNSSLNNSGVNKMNQSNNIIYNLKTGETAEQRWLFFSISIWNFNFILLNPSISTSKVHSTLWVYQFLNIEKK